MTTSSKRVGLNLTVTVLLLCLNLLLASCSTDNGEMSGVVNIWHSWGEEEARVLNQVLTSFTDLHPEVTVRATFIDPKEIQRRFTQSAAAGLGPDILLGPSSWILSMADAGLIQRVDSILPSDTWDRYLPASVETVRYEDMIYGVPESLRLSGLYYNKNMVDTPPLSLDALLHEAGQGNRVGMSPAFKDAFWGIQAFGGQLFDDDGRVVLDNGGFANWLVWLKFTLEIPNIVLDKDPQTLTTLFAEGDLAYLVAGSWMRKELQSKLGVDNLGVAPLPSGPIQAAGPFLETDTFMFNIASSPRQFRLATELALFATNAEQQTVLMRRAGRLPTNVRVRNNPSIDPIAHTFRTQARSAVPMRNTHFMDAVSQLGNDAYNRALQGVAEPVTVAVELTRAINEANGFPVADEMIVSCTGSGALTVWLRENMPESAALLAITERFEQACPGIRITLETVSEAQMLERLTAGGLGDQPDLMLIPNQGLVDLVSNSMVQPLNGFADTQLLQTYHPGAVASMRLDNQLYAVPFALMPQALYVNSSLVAEPAQDLADLVAQGQLGMTTAMSLSFVDAFWGISAFGGRLFDENGLVILDQGGMTDWLLWLTGAQSSAGLVTDRSNAAMRAQFAAGNVGYLVDRSDALAQLEEALGDNLRVARLPSGPVADAAPILVASGFALHKELSEAEAKLALQFIIYATELETQELLVREMRLLPANIGVSIAETDPLSVFAEQAGTSIAYPNRPQMVAVEQLGSQFYDHLWTDNEAENGVQDLDGVVRSIVTDINAANGIEALIDVNSVEDEDN